MAEVSRTSSDEDERDDDGLEFGRRIRHLRERAGISLADLSERSGVSRAMLSKVERGEKSPTVGIARRIADALDTTLAFLTGTREQHRTAIVVSERERPVFRDAETGFEKYILSPNVAGSTTEVIYHRLPAGTSTGSLPAYPAGTEKHVVVAEGEVSVVMRGTAYRLRQGDTFFFEADVDHAFENDGDRASAYYLFISRCVYSP